MIKVYEKFPVPDNHTILFSIGSYTFTMKDNEEYICGSQVRKVKDEYFISTIKVDFATKEQCNDSNQSAFDLEDNKIYYDVTVSNFAFIFDNVEDVAQFVGVFSKIFKEALEYQKNNEKSN